MNEEKYCSDCGKVINRKAEICPHCGVRQIPIPNILNGRNRVIAAILAFFLGGIGGHKFYLGEFVWGLLYMAFCWTFIPAIIALIEFVILLAMTDEQFNKKYNQE